MARAMYAPGPDEAELAAFGLSLADFEQDPIEIWPDNLQAFEIFSALATQWRIGMNGPTGLDYNVLYHKMDRLGLAPERYEELEAEVRVMESAALEEISSKSKKP